MIRQQATIKLYSVDFTIFCPIVQRLYCTTGKTVGIDVKREHPSSSCFRRGDGYGTRLME